MYKQVKFACIYKKQPKSYAEHLFTSKKYLTGTVQNYLANLENLKKGEIEEILPPHEYFCGVSKKTDKNNEIVKNEENVKNSEKNSKKISESDENEEIFPSVNEIYENLTRIKDKYERNLSIVFKNIEKLDEKNSQLLITIEKPFTFQCPVF